MLKLLQATLPALGSYLKQRFDKPTGIAFIDSISHKACHNMRIPRHHVFADETKRGKGTMGWFYGFNLHLIMNGEDGLLAVKVTAGNVDDRKPVPDMVENVTGSAVLLRAP